MFFIKAISGNNIFAFIPKDSLFCADGNTFKKSELINLLKLLYKNMILLKLLYF